MVTYNFHKTNTLIGYLIRIFTKSEFNHVSVTVDGYTYEADILQGVWVVPKEKNIGIIKSVEIKKVNDCEVIYFINEQLGKKYDLLGVLSFIWRFLPNRIGRWYCSELAMVSLCKGLGVEEFNQKVTPKDFYYVTQLVK